MQNANGNVVYATLPAPSSFYEPIEFHAALGLSQTAYEAKIRGGWRPTDCDYIDLVVVNGVERQTIITHRAVLEEAPLFAAFFASEHYLRGACFTITLPRQSVTCIHSALKVFMRLAPNPTDDLRRYLGDFLHADQVLFLAGLCRLAVHLRADLLEGVARDLLTEIAHLITPEDCVALVGIIYNGDVTPSAFLRAYVLAALRQHERTLHGYEEGESKSYFFSL